MAAVDQGCMALWGLARRRNLRGKPCIKYLMTALDWGWCRLRGSDKEEERRGARFSTAAWWTGLLICCQDQRGNHKPRQQNIATSIYHFKFKWNYNVWLNYPKKHSFGSIISVGFAYVLARAAVIYERNRGPKVFHLVESPPFDHSKKATLIKQWYRILR